MWSEDLRRRSQVSRINNLKQKAFAEWGRKLKEELILSEQDEKCLLCKTSREWNGKVLTFELDHIDGNNKNNSRENLRLLCPNCHSTTDNWRGRNINSGLVKVSDEDIISELNLGKNVRQVLLAVGLAAKGGNYTRVKKLQNLSAQSETIDVEPFKVGEGC
jgi:RNA polymerase subunit RPABC4/transcription elongation factor Spt4